MRINRSPNMTMNRPSNRLDAALPASGRALFPTTDCAGLSLRALAGNAGVNARMFHSHFKSKDNFLRALLQQMYKEMFASLELDAGNNGPALMRLRAALLTFARFARDNRRVLARIWMDVLAGLTFRTSIDAFAMNYEAGVWERKAPVGTPSRLRIWHCISDSSGSKT